MSETVSSSSDLLHQIHLCEFPQGLRVLVVENDPVYLQELLQLLQTFHYEVTKCGGSDEALNFLTDRKEKFDVVVVDFDTLDMNGFEFLEVAGMASSLPIVGFSSNRDPSYIKEGLIRGASAFFVKPLSIEAMGMLWHFPVRHLSSGTSDSEMTARENLAKKCAKTNKPRFVWTKEVEALFVEAVNFHGGPDCAVPKKIHEYMIGMGVTGLNNRHISSHLQKHRADMKLLQQQSSAQQMDCTSVPFPMLNTKYLPYNTSKPCPYGLSRFHNHNNVVSNVGPYLSQPEVLQGPSSYLGFEANPKQAAFLNPNNRPTSPLYPGTMFSALNPNPSLHSSGGSVFHNQNGQNGLVISHPTTGYNASYSMTMESFVDDQPFLRNSDVVALTDVMAATFYNPGDMHNFKV